MLLLFSFCRTALENTALVVNVCYPGYVCRNIFYCLWLYLLFIFWLINYFNFVYFCKWCTVTSLFLFTANIYLLTYLLSLFLFWSRKLRLWTSSRRVNIEVKESGSEWWSKSHMNKLILWLKSSLIFKIFRLLKRGDVWKGYCTYDFLLL